jgi:hypothetical protein
LICHSLHYQGFSRFFEIADLAQVLSARGLARS